ncbi:uncharacterized protein LOC125533704 [Triticum urartu]|uniref:uncharacterized protein LOC125533704 n=1 Tax=Triticum urartu TaxID=4572 RepID=UPI00204364D4|nr:uncharacterized protein LOC125533704 [Triticum urartu]
MALVRNLAALLCVVLASLAFVAQAVLAARGDLSNVKRDGVRGTWASPSSGPVLTFLRPGASFKNEPHEERHFFLKDIVNNFIHIDIYHKSLSNFKHLTKQQYQEFISKYDLIIHQGHGKF